MARLRALVRPAGGPPPAIPAAAPSPPTPPADATAVLSPPEGPGEIGRLGGYRVLKVLGKGGMGMVLAAEDTRLGRPVALKVMLPELAANPEARSRFVQEARAAAKVEHDNIIPIWQVAEDRGVPFLAMPLLSGVALEDALKMGRPLPLSMVLPIARQVTEGLAAAHAVGLIHRDIKPSNVWLEMTADGAVRRARILDFGLARLDQDDGKLTRTGMILGTPAYMAPEQARGQRVDARADLFSLGASLYQMTTGRTPFQGRDTLAVLTALMTDTPAPVRDLNPAVPAALADLIGRLMAKDPADRPGSAAEVADELRRIAESGAPPVADPAPASGRGPWRWRPAVAAVILALSGAGGLAAYSGTLVRVATNTGELVVEADDPGVEVVIRSDGGVVIDDRPRDRRFVLTAGTGVVEFRDPASGAVALTERFRIERGGRTVLAASVRKPTGATTREPSAQVVPTPPDAGSAEARKALTAVLALGGKVVFAAAGKEYTVGPGQKLPDPPDRVRDILLDGVQVLTPAAVAPLADLPPVSGTLSLAESNATDAVLGTLAGFPAFRTTERVNLTGCGVTDDGLGHLARLPALSFLLLEKVRVTEHGLAAVGQVRGLTRLKASGPGITAAGLRHLRGLGLTNIDIREAPRFDDEAQAVLAEFPTLTDVILMRVPVTDAGVRAFARLPAVHQLCLSADRLTPAAIDAVAGMKSLRTLSLLGYRGEPASLARLSQNGDLMMLDLSWSRLTEADFTHLHGLRRLVHLRLLGLPLTEPGLKTLAETFPHARIEWDGGAVSPRR